MREKKAKLEAEMKKHQEKHDKALDETTKKYKKAEADATLAHK